MHHLLFLAFLIVACVYAAIWGGAPERIVALTFALGGPLTAAAGWVLGYGYGSVALYRVLVDVAVLAPILVVALASTRFWPMMMAGLQLVGVLGHAPVAIAPDVVPEAYYALVALWSYPMLGLLIVAVARHRRRLRRYGVDPAWVSQLPSNYLAGASAGAKAG